MLKICGIVFSATIQALLFKPGRHISKTENQDRGSYFPLLITSGTICWEAGFDILLFFTWLHY